MSLDVRLDHLLFGAPNLDDGVREVAARLGVAPAAGGVHPTMGTTNALLSLGDDGVYLEVLAPTPGHAELRGFGKELAGLTAPAIVNWAARATDLDAVAAAARAAGLAPSVPHPGSRRTSDGELLEWRMLMIGGHDFGTFVPFFIDWGATAHPSTTSPAGPRLDRFSVAHPRAADLARLYRALGLDMEVAEGVAPRFTVQIDGVVLTGP